VNFFDADRLAGKDRAEVNLFVTETDAAAVGDDDDFVVEGIIDIGQSLVGAGRGLIDPCGRGATGQKTKRAGRCGQSPGRDAFH
jgi:hypothetical protein